MLVSVAGEDMTLLPERAVYWERGAALFIADLHWGKAATFRAKQMAVPETGADDLGRLERVIAQTQPTTLYILGDLIHAKLGRTPSTFAIFTAWRTAHEALDIVLVRGNHDQHAGDPPDEWHIRCVDAPFALPPFVLLHQPTIEADDGYALAGHVHPSIVLTGTGRQTLKVPCFWFSKTGAVLPAFGSFTGMAAITPSAGDRVYVTTDKAVIEIRGR